MATESLHESTSVAGESKENMKPQSGDTIINRYVLVSPLYEGHGMQVWKADDQLLEQSCQVFIITDTAVIDEAGTVASQLAMTPEHRCTPILHIHHDDGILVIITALDAGMSLADYLSDSRYGHVDYDAIRSIIGDTAYTAHHLIECGIAHHAICADTVRLSASGIQLADTPVSAMIQINQPWATADSTEEQAVSQLAALLYRLLTHTEYHGESHLDALPENTPAEFRVICERGLRITEQDTPLASLPEIMALLNWWVTVPELGDHIIMPTQSGRNSITGVTIRETNNHIDTDFAAIITAHAAIDNPTVADVNHPDTHTSSTTVGTAQSDNNVDNTATLPTVHPSHLTGLAVAGSSFKNLWNTGRELLNEGIDSGHHEDDANTFESFPKTDAAPDDSHLTIPLDVSSIRDESDNPFEQTSRIPVIDPDGHPIAETSTQALQTEHDIPDNSVPPSFRPTHVVRVQDLEDDVADETLFGRFTTKTVAIVVAVILVVIALIGTIHVLSNNSSDPNLTQTDGQSWPEFDPNAVPFGDDATADNASSDNSDANAADKAEDHITGKEQEQQSTPSDEDNKSNDVITTDKQVSAIPAPRQLNTTPYDIERQTFLDLPEFDGYCYAVHLAQPQDVYRMTITIRSSGGKGYVRANATDPNAGEQVAEFTFADGGTTDVTFTKSVHTQDLLLWVPSESLPQGQLYIDQIQFF